MSFVHLHVHSDYSLLDGACKVEDLARRARELGMPALALTDHGNLHGAVEFHDACLRHGVQPILGMEAYVAPGSRLERSFRHGLKEAAYHLVLLARDAEGWRNLMALSSIGYLQGYYYRPRVDLETLEKHAGGLMALSGCLSGEIPMFLAKGEEEMARERLGRYMDIFGSGNFYVELQDHGLPEQKVLIRRLLKLARDNQAPVLATNDSHYLDPDMAEAHDVLLCIQTGARVEDTDRLRFGGREHYLKSPDEMARRFAELPEALRGTLEAAARCHLELPKLRPAMPAFAPPAPFTSADAYLEHLCRHALPQRYADRAEAAARLERELRVIRELGFAGYFLAVADFVNWAKSKGIRVGPGRGSAAGSIVAYLLGITALDPLAHGLLFERFLNPDRASPPDIDVDFADDRRDEVIAYVQERYGREHVAPIITFGTLGARAVLRDAGRALGLPYSEVDQLVRLVPPGADMTLERALRESAEFKAAASEGRAARLLEIARKLEGLIRNASKHAAGVVLSPEPLLNRLPLCLDKSPSAAEQEGGPPAVITQFDMASVERVGLVKVDFLGLRTLRLIEETLRLLGDRAPDLDRLPDGDAETFDMLGRGEAHGVFQLESAGMRDLLRRFKPRCLEDLDQLIALYRPGPMENIADYLARREGRQKPSYLLPELEPILSSTCGTILYQEQVMRIAMDIGGLSAAQADLLRRAMSKKDPDLLERHRLQFQQGAVARGLSAEKAEQLFDLLARFADYGFNKAHSASYALLAYQTAWLKRHHAPEFHCALLSTEMGDADKVVATLGECRRLGIAVLPPALNESGAQFTLGASGIRFGLAAVKHVGLSAMQALAEERERGGAFASLRDLLRRMGPRLPLKAVESLIKAGALDGLEGGAARRAALLAALPRLHEEALREHADLASGQGLLFGEVAPPADPLPEAPAWPEPVRLAFEKEVLGFYVSGHPLQEHEALLEALDVTPLAALKELSDGAACLCCGVVLGLKIQSTRRGEPFARVVLEDFSGVGEVWIWPRAYKEFSALLKKDAALACLGRADLSGDEAKLSVEALAPLEQAAARFGKRLHVHPPSWSESDAEVLIGWIRRHPGSVPLTLHWEAAGRRAVQPLPKAGVSLDPAALAELAAALPGRWRVER